MGGIFGGDTPRTEIDPSADIEYGFQYADDEDTSYFGDWATGEEGKLADYTAEYDPFTGETSYFKDIDVADVADIAEKLGSLGKQPGAIAQSGRLPSPSIPGGRRGSFSETQSPYQTPTYLASSLDYNKMINQLVTGLLKQNVRRTKLSTLV